MERVDVTSSQSTEMIPITEQVREVVRESGVYSGICYLYVPHTTAAVTINEQADPMVAHDVLQAMDQLIPLVDPAYRHLEENSAAHVKAILFGTAETVLIDEGELVLGTWQGIFFCEFDGPRRRHLLVKVVGD